jgi:NIMA (never in mitosis gene a)-related kinase 2
MKTSLIDDDWTRVEAARCTRFVRRCRADSRCSTIPITRQIPAHQTDLKVFARKIVRPFGNFRQEDVNNEIRALNKLCGQTSLKCSNLVKVFKHGILPNSSYYHIDMEMCEVNLNDYIQGVRPSISQERVSTPVAVPEIWQIMGDISSGLSFVHSLGEVHRDLKPRNGILQRNLLIQVLYSGNDSSWKIADFGITAPGTSQKIFSSVYCRGTPNYRAPELLGEEPKFNSRSDIWALGCILFEMTTKEKPFPDDYSVGQFAKAGREFVIPSSKLSSFDAALARTIKEMITKMLNVTASKRPSAKSLQVEFNDLYQKFESSLQESGDFTGGSGSDFGGTQRRCY